jgi:osmotically-inducible protein OsmY
MKKTDEQLQRDVVAELDWDPSVDPADIGVSVHDGVVTLSGYVTSYAQKIAAEKAARRVSGVTAIAEDIVVRFATDPKIADHEIARRIVDMFAWNVSVPEKDVQVKVEHGFVTLTGSVDWNYQRQEARKIAGKINGVKGVADLIRLRQPIDSFDVKQRIRAAIKRQADRDANAITD